MLVFEERGKPEYPEKNLSEQSFAEPSLLQLIWHLADSPNSSPNYAFFADLAGTEHV